MSVISELYACSPCEIKTMSNELLTNAIIKVVDNDCIEVVSHSDALPIIHCNTQVKINIFNNALGFIALVGRVFISSAQLMKIAEVQNLVDFERRQFFRIKVNMAAKACLINDDAAPDSISQLFPVNILDISLSGCLIRTKELLSVGQKLIIHMNLLSEPGIAFNSEVQREQPVTEKTSGYGCMFLDCSNRQLDLLCNYIFQKQREQIMSMRKAQAFRNGNP